MPHAANDNHGQEAAEVGRSRPCPICGKRQVHAYRPFCSKRCADVDLAHWLGGRYAIPAEPESGATAHDEHEGES